MRVISVKQLTISKKALQRDKKYRTFHSGTQSGEENVKRKFKEPPIPVEMNQTVRQKIMSLLEGTTLSAKDISTHVIVSEREVYEHLEHIQKTMNRSKGTLNITPALCKKCGFSFRKRDRLSKPGKCPVCRNKLIEEPLFSISKGV